MLPAATLLTTAFAVHAADLRQGGAGAADAVSFKPFGEFLTGNFAYDGTWFGLGNIPPSEFDDFKAWSEEWLEIGARLEADAGDFTLYGGLSAGGTFTLGTDSFDETDQHDVLPETAYAGVRTNNSDDAWNIALSAGQQDFGAGTGMLLWQGAGNGFERGGLNIVQRTAWSMAAVAEVTGHKHKLQAFYLNPNELESNDTKTDLLGALWRYDHSAGSNLGAYYLNVLNSEMIYPLPDLPLFIPDGRDGLQAIQGFARLDGNDVGLANAWARAEFAYEWNGGLAGTGGMEAWAGYGELGYRFVGLPWAPALSYAFASFSGDDPSTSVYERFDPLFYGNGLDNWWFGANGSYAFLNSNLNFHRFTLQMVAGEQDFLKFQYVITNANELNSPIQFGQAARPDLESGGLIVGAPAHHLADEIYGEWTHLFTPSISATLWGSIAIPGDGIEEVDASVPAENWLGAGLVLSLRTP
ncbi:alginate export family protein [Aestuariivirga sp.]|uniref:alginate export family protein n=1 Tax=Aestuariivirga sp. TaxID=2650926 RepID=UPI003918E7A8